MIRVDAACVNPGVARLRPDVQPDGPATYSQSAAAGAKRPNSLHIGVTSAGRTHFYSAAPALAKFRPDRGRA